MLKGQPCTTNSDCNAGEICQAQSNETCDSIHRLVDMASRHVSADWPPVVHVGDCSVVPRATWDVRAVKVSNSTESDALGVATVPAPAPNQWADCVGPLGPYCTGNSEPCGDNACPEFDTCEGLLCTDGLTPCGDDACLPGESCIVQWSPPDGTTNFVDLQAATFAFKQNPALTIPAIQWLDMHGAAFGSPVVDPPNHVVNVFDIQQITFAFTGRPYLFSDPILCP